MSPDPAPQDLGPNLAAQPGPCDVRPDPGTRLAALHAQYPALKAEADAGAERLKACTDGIKAELGAQLPEGAIRGLLRDPAGQAPPLALTYSETWRFDSRRFKAEDPETYVRYAKKSGSWALRVASADGAGAGGEG